MTVVCDDPGGARLTDWWRDIDPVLKDPIIVIVNVIEQLIVIIIEEGH